MLRRRMTGYHKAIWSTAFGRWVRRRSIAGVMRDLAAIRHPAARSTVYSWLSGSRMPRDWGWALSKSTRGQLRFEDVFRHR